MSNQSDLAKSASGFNGDPLSIDTANNRVGIGKSSPSYTFDVAGDCRFEADGGSGAVVYRFENSGTTSSDNAVVRIAVEGTTAGSFIQFGDADDSNRGQIEYDHNNDALVIDVAASEAMRIDSSGNLLVGKTVVNNDDNGLLVQPNGNSWFTATGNYPLGINRKTSDGALITFTKDQSTVGSIGTINGDLTIFSTATGHSGLRFASTYVGPTNNSGTSVDNTFDMGAAAYRWDDIYASNGTIQTSDQNEKQQIAALTDAEITAAKAISKLFKTFKWNDSVAEKGDAARTHSGVIAQEVEQAMTDAGLNAGDYAFFISSDWTDEETGEERNRKGIRYPQLMSFIGAATEQRLASIEARLDALEGN